jgi:hypothetical protein
MDRGLWSICCQGWHTACLAPPALSDAILLFEGHRDDAKVETAVGLCGMPEIALGLALLPGWWGREETGAGRSCPVCAWIGPGYHASQRTRARLQSVLPQVDDGPSWRVSVLRRDAAGLTLTVAGLLVRGAQPTRGRESQESPSLSLCGHSLAAELASTRAGSQFGMLTGQCTSPPRSSIPE